MSKIAGMKFILCFLSLLLVSCNQHYLQVDKLAVDRNSLASTFARSPDPEQIKPPTGEKLYISWALPFSAKPKDYHLVLSVIYKNLTQEQETYPIARRIGFLSFPLINKKYKDTEGFYAYKVDLVDAEGKILDTWQHQMWVTLL